MSQGTVELDKLGCRQGGDKVGELPLEHQSKEITADRGRSRQAIFRPQHNLSCKSQNFPIDGGADDRGHILMHGHKSPGHYNVKPWLAAALGDPLSGAVDLASPHGRACSEMRARAWRANRFRCFRNTALSLASIFRRRSRSANSRSAIRTSAERFLSCGEAPVNSSRSFRVESSIVIAIVFILGSVSAFWADFNVAAAQQLGKIPRVGVLEPGLSPEKSATSVFRDWFRQGLRELGYVEGQHISIEYRFAEGQVERLPILAAELVRLKPDVIRTHSIAAARAAKQASIAISIVVGVGSDFVEHGLVTSFAQPCGNVTGLERRDSDLTRKRLELLQQAVPAASRVAVLIDPANPAHASIPGNVEAEARR